jgi:hypothetical protein
VGDHPVKVPPELVKNWLSSFYGAPIAPGEATIEVANQAAQWGAGQEMEACCDWLEARGYSRADVDRLRAARRSKPPTLAEEATAELDDAVMRGDCITTTDAMPLLRAALNRLAELEAQQ